MTEPTSGLQEKPEYLPGMDFVLQQSQREPAPYKTVVLGKEFWVLPGVFSPKYYAETAFYTERVVSLLKPGERYLDMGCGVGVTAVTAALKGVDVVALDINPQAVENTRRNAALHEVTNRVRVLESDVYSALDPSERFDTIYWNAPFGFRKDGTPLTPLEEAIFDPGYRKNWEFITGAKAHLRPGGQLLMGASSTLGHLDAILGFGAEAGIHLTQVGEITDPDAPTEIKFQLLRAIV